MSFPEKSDNENKFDPPSKEAFICKQIDIFQSFLCNSDGQREKMSNAIPLWDCLPLYSVSRQWAHKMRKEGNFPQLLIRDSLYKGSKIRIEIQPARILENGVVTEYYPGANDELIEAALRKIATIQNYGYYDESTLRCGVNFSIYQLRKELKNRGHARSYQEIVLSLRILARSSIEITANNNKTKIYDVSNYFSRLSSVSRFDIEEDPHARWYVEFHPLITKALKAIDYRQFNYELMMSHDTQLTRWLHKYLIAKFTYAGRGQKFEIRYSTDGNCFTLTEWEQRLSLPSGMATWLHAYLASHKEPYPIKIETIISGAGLTMKTKHHAKAIIVEALDKLIEIDFLASWEIKNDLVTVVRKLS